MEGKVKDVKDYSSVMSLLSDGYGLMLCSTVMECVELFLPSLIKSGSLPGDELLESHVLLCDLLRALLKDECGVEL